MGGNMGHGNHIGGVEGYTSQEAMTWVNESYTGLKIVKKYFMLTNIEPINNKGQRHGLWVVYWFRDQLYYTGKYVNDERHGYWVTYYADGSLCSKGTYDMGKRIGIWGYGYNEEKILYAN